MGFWDIVPIYAAPSNNEERKMDRLSEPRFFYISDNNLKRITVARIYDREREVYYYSYAICNKKDIFKKEVGRKIALGRLQKILTTSPETVTVVREKPSERIMEVIGKDIIKKANNSNIKKLINKALFGQL